MFDARKNDKMLQCEWIDEKNEGKRCTHLVIINEDLKDHESSWLVIEAYSFISMFEIIMR